jgi:hypothetical protein
MFGAVSHQERPHEGIMKKGHPVFWKNFWQIYNARQPAILPSELLSLVT